MKSSCKAINVCLHDQGITSQGKFNPMLNFQMKCTVHGHSRWALCSVWQLPNTFLTFTPWVITNVYNWYSEISQSVITTWTELTTMTSYYSYGRMCIVTACNSGEDILDCNTTGTWLYLPQLGFHQISAQCWDFLPTVLVISEQRL